MTLLFYVSARLRFMWLLHVLRALRNFPLLKHAVSAWDPNTIRKRVPVLLPERRALLDFDSYRLWVNLNDHIGYNTFMRNEPFEMGVYRIARRLKLSSGDIILDIGANIGTASVPFCAESGCELIAVEASKRNGDLLGKNVRENRVNAKICLVALTSPSNARRHIPLYVRDGNTGANSIYKEWNPSLVDSDVEMVPTQTLDDLLKDEALDRIRLVKIDVEGAEAEVLRGAQSFLERCDAPILMEYRIDGTRKYFGSDMAESLELLRKSHTVKALNREWSLEDFDSSRSYENIIFVPNARVAEIGALTD